MKYKCSNCGKEYVCPYERNPPPTILIKSPQFVLDQNTLSVYLKLACQCKKIIGEIVHSSSDVEEIGWWRIYPQFRVQKGTEDNQEMDWISMVKAASSRYVLRISNLAERLKKVQDVALQVNQLLHEIHLKSKQ